MIQLPTLILASKSPRRQYLLKEAGFSFEIRTKEVDESFPPHLSNEEVALFLASKKSDAFDLKDGEILVTADTIVCLDKEVINKPENETEAYLMLRKLSGRMHRVYTGVTIRNNKKKHSFFELTNVYFRRLTEDEIHYYIQTEKPLDKAGAYGIQEWLGYVAVTKIEGCYYNVMGFPIAKFYSELLKFDQ